MSLNYGLHYVTFGLCRSCCVSFFHKTDSVGIPMQSCLWECAIKLKIFFNLPLLCLHWHFEVRTCVFDLSTAWHVSLGVVIAHMERNLNLKELGIWPIMKAWYTYNLQYRCKSWILWMVLLPSFSWSRIKICLTFFPWKNVTPLI